MLAAAATVYARRGFDGATVDEIAEEAGYTKGAVYDHFGSKENLLVALLDEHLAAQIAEQIALFDPSKQTSERSRAGADRWMKRLEEDPDAFRLFVEAWVRAQRDEELRDRVVGGFQAWRATFRDFGAAKTARSSGEVSDALLDEVANLMLALGAGVGIVKLADPDGISSELLGAAFVILLQTLETSREARELLAGAAAGRVHAEIPRELRT